MADPIYIYAAGDKHGMFDEMANEKSSLNLDAGIKFFHTIRANAVGEFRFGMVADVDFNLVPIALVIPYLLLTKYC